MMSLEKRMNEEVKNKKSTLMTVEKDYALSYIIYSISSHPLLKDTLIFKGGTALKKTYFGNYRFSEDLDYSSINSPSQNELKAALHEVILFAEKLLCQYGPIQVVLRQNPEKNPHPRGQDAYNIYVRFPWHSKNDNLGLCKIKIEITHDELVLSKPVYKPLIHGYQENLECMVACYSIEEIIAEKMRALLQTHQRLIARPWNRPRARDYYDLWRLLKEYSRSINKDEIRLILSDKCDHRGVSYSIIDDFFTDELIAEATKHWENSLQLQTHDLPSCQVVLSETKGLLEELC